MDTLSPQAAVFAALGDETRLRLLDRIGGEGPLSIARLATGASITRQAITKHLHVLAAAGLVHGRREGREQRWEVALDQLAEARHWLDLRSREWDVRLERLRLAVEEDAGPDAENGIRSPDSPRSNAD